MGTVLLRDGRLLGAEGAMVREDLLIEDGRIAALGRDLPVPGGAEVLELQGDLVIPGLVNAHTHSNQTLEKGLADRLPLDAWMVVASYGGAGALLAPDELQVSALMGAAEMLRTGTTSVIDCARVDLSCFDEGLDAIMGAYDTAGMRAGVAAQYSDVDFFTSLPLEMVDGGEHLLRPPRATPDEVLGRAEAFVDRWQGRHPRLQPMLGPSSLPRCSVELFEASVELARRRHVRLQTHLLSARSQAPFAHRRYGRSMVRHLEAIGCLEEWASFAHAIWLDDEEVRILGGSPAVAVHNPTSNLKLGAGIAPVPDLLAAGGRVALGADGASSNDSQNMWETVKLSALVHRVVHEPEHWPGASDALDMCWQGGATALGWPVGSLEVGSLGDVAVLRWGQLLPGPADQVRQQLVYSELGSSVDTVVIDGEVVVRHGQVRTFDVGEVEAQAEEIVARLWETLPARLAAFDEFAPTLAALQRAVARHPLGFQRSCEW